MEDDILYRSRGDGGGEGRFVNGALGITERKNAIDLEEKEVSLSGFLSLKFAIVSAEIKYFLYRLKCPVVVLSYQTSNKMYIATLLYKMYILTLFYIAV